MERDVWQDHVVTRGNRFKLKDGRVRFDIKKKLFTVRQLKP